ncbi:hypothetical protein [Streptomyces albidoflavus]|uniref:hypothetical protein n=1 Tax=Streptomyces albidoflavus TaxID=1886 RepID=UPI00331B30DD
MDWNDPDGVRFAEVPFYSRSLEQHLERVEQAREKFVNDWSQKWGERPRWRELADERFHYQWRHTQKVGYLELRAYANSIRGYRWDSVSKNPRYDRSEPHQIECTGKFLELDVPPRAPSVEIFEQIDYALRREHSNMPKSRFIDMSLWRATAQFTNWRAFFDEIGRAAGER